MVPPEAYCLSSFAPLHTALLAPKLRSPSSQDISGTAFLVLNLRRSLLWPQGGAQAPFQDCLQGWERLAQSRSLTGLAFLCLFNQPPTREKSALVHCWKAEKSPHPSSFRQHHSLSFLSFFPPEAGPCRLDSRHSVHTVSHSAFPINVLSQAPFSVIHTFRI